MSPANGQGKHTMSSLDSSRSPSGKSTSVCSSVNGATANGVHLSSVNSENKKHATLVRPLRAPDHELFFPYHRPQPSLPPLHLRIPLLLFGILAFPPRLILGFSLVVLCTITAVIVPKSISPILLAHLARAILLVVGFHTINTIIDPDPDPRTKTVNMKNITVIANHVSMFDPLVCLWDHIGGFVAKAPVKHIPFVGPIAQAVDSLFVDRVSGSGRITQQLAQRQRDPQATSLIVFAEGTTTNGRYLLRFRTGAFVAGVPVMPVVIRYPFRRFSPSYETVRWWQFLLGILMEPYNCVEYIHLPIYYPSEEEKSNPRLYADNVRMKMAARGQLELSDATFADKLEFHHIVRGDPLPKHLKIS